MISARLDSECINGKRVSGIFLMLIAGATLGSPLNQSFGEFIIKTPGIYGLSPWTLVGPFTWIVGTFSPGFGGTVAVTVYMGMGIGSFNFSWTFGLDIGIDVMGGISLPLYFSKKSNCKNE